MTHGTARLTHGGRFLTVTTHRKRGKKSVPMTQTYVVEDARPDPRVASPVLTLTKEDGEQYHLSVNEFGTRCDCFAGEIGKKRGTGHCKHILAAMSVGLLPKG